MTIVALTEVIFTFFNQLAFLQPYWALSIYCLFIRERGGGGGGGGGGKGTSRFMMTFFDFMLTV